MSCDEEMVEVPSPDHREQIVEVPSSDYKFCQDLVSDLVDMAAGNIKKLLPHFVLSSAEMTEEDRIEDIPTVRLVKNVEEQQKKERERFRKSSSYFSTLHQTLRRLAKAGDHEELKSFLLENPGININLPDQEGSTVLNEIVTKNAQFYRVAKLLLDAGAKVDVKDSLGNTPLHNSVLYYPATEEIIQLLLDSNANTQERNCDGRTPVQMCDSKFLAQVLRSYSSSSSSGCSSRPAKPITPLRKYLLNSTNGEVTSPAVPKIICVPTPPDASPRSILKRKRGNDPEESPAKTSVTSLSSVRGSSCSSAAKCSSSGVQMSSSSSVGAEKTAFPARKRIKFAANDSLGGSIDGPVFSDDDEED